MATNLTTTAFNFADPPAFTSTQRGDATAVLIFTELALFLNGVALFVLFKNRRKVSNTTSLLLIANVLCIDAIYLHFSHIVYLYKLSRNRYPLGFAGCQYEGILTLCSTMWINHNLVILAAHQYLLVVRGRQWSPSRWKAAMVYSWSVSVLLALIPLSSNGAGFALQPSGIYCTSNWQGRQPLQLLATLMPLLVVLALQHVCTALYIAIYRCVRQTTQQVELHRSPSQALKPKENATCPSTADLGDPQEKRRLGNTLSKYTASALLKAKTLSSVGLSSLQDLTSTNANSTKDLRAPAPPPAPAAPRASEAEKRVMRRLANMYFCLLISWSPYAVNIAMSIAGIAVPPLGDTIAVISPLCGSCNISLFLMTMDTSFNKLVKDELRRLHRWTQQMRSSA
ncbi:hypothetical protein RI367_006578 [Sorochytrium milnesiophthora]